MIGSNRKLFVVSAPSGAGKTTLCERLICEIKGLVRSISMTTREKRPGETHNKDYFFISKTEFARKIRKGEFLEYAEVFGNYYGTPRTFVVKNLKKGNDVLLNIDVQGAMQIRRNFRKNCVLIFVLPPSIEALEKRLLNRRTDTKEQIRRRLQVAKKEISYLKFYDFKIINDNFNVALNQLSSIIISERCKIYQTDVRRRRFM